MKFFEIIIQNITLKVSASLLEIINLAYTDILLLDSLKIL